MPDDEKPVEEVNDESNVSVEPEQPETEESVDSEESSDAKAMEDSSAEADEEPKGPNRFQKLFAKYKANKKVSIPVTVVVLLAIIFGIPVTRYTVLGLVIRKDVNVTIVDSQTSVPVSGADVSLHGKAAKTDGQGKAVIKSVKVGKGTLKATKKYYKDSSISVVVGLKGSSPQLKLEATGRQVPVHVVNKITGANVAGANVTAADTEAQTDQNGEATLVLPANESTVDATVKKDGYNNASVKVKINNAQIKDNTFGLVSAGKIYFLSKQSGKIDVVKTDLDGTNRQTVLAGTGSEEDGNTVLLASRDWKFLALQSRRDGATAKLYLIDTSNDQLTEMDSGDASFTPVGWSNHQFVYKVYRNNAQIWQPKGQALKTYNAEAKQLLTIDETNAEGTSASDYASESFDGVYILKDTLLYSKHWNASYYSVYRLAGKRMGIYSASAGGTGKQTVKDFDVGNNGYFNAALSKPNEVYYGVFNAAQSFYEYRGGKLAEATDVNLDSFSKVYPTYLVSPGGNSTFWSEPRDGKNTLFVGNVDAANGKQIATLSDYSPYGWYSDDYVLVSKNGSELYIQPAGGVGTTGQILKISDYHKPAASFYGYGGGYGGL